jgi:hypothetical protein
MWHSQLLSQLLPTDKSLGRAKSIIIKTRALLPYVQVAKKQVLICVAYNHYSLFRSCIFILSASKLPICKFNPSVIRNKIT